VTNSGTLTVQDSVGGGKITAVTQPGLERIIHFHIEHLDEMGDIGKKHLIV
jgi:predicted ribosome quality control (RQC) complex YloA/Tae2 family protein